MTPTRLFLVGLWLFWLINVSSVCAKSQNHEEEWLAGFFPDIDNCTPANLYFDKKTNSSNSRILERKGYGRPYLKQDLAIYSIKERFFGFQALEFSIPASTTSIYAVTVNVEAKKLADKIFMVTNKKIGIYEGKPAESGRAYIARKGSQKSIFVCFTFEGGL